MVPFFDVCYYIAVGSVRYGNGHVMGTTIFNEIFIYISVVVTSSFVKVVTNCHTIFVVVRLPSYLKSFFHSVIKLDHFMF